MKHASIVAIFCVLLLAGCAASPRVLLHDPPRAESVAALVERSLLPPGENIRATEVGRGESSSVHLVQIRDREKPHVHARYDLTVVVAEGRGRLWLAGEELPMRAGDAVFIPRGTPHFFVNEGTEPAAAIVVFSPAFNGPDSQPVR
jgi:mannose-6-phosphate isomerase-like protein (cupin superfamily)